MAPFDVVVAKLGLREVAEQRESLTWKPHRKDGKNILFIHLFFAPNHVKSKHMLCCVESELRLWQFHWESRRMSVEDQRQMQSVDWLHEASLENRTRDRKDEWDGWRVGR